MPAESNWWQPGTEYPRQLVSRQGGFQVTFAVVALLCIILGIYSLITKGWDWVDNALTPFAFIAALVLAGLYFLTPHVPTSVSGGLFLAFVNGIAIGYVMYEWAVGNPLTSNIYILFPALSAIMFARFRGAMIALGFSTIWLWFSNMMGFVQPFEDELIGLSVIIPFMAAIAWMVKKERDRVHEALLHWSDAHGGLESILRSTPDGVIYLDDLALPEFCNGVAIDWLRAINPTHPQGPRFWRAFDKNLQMEFDHAYARALTGNPSRVRFRQPLSGLGAEWEAKFNPQVGGDGVVVSIRDMAEEIEHQAQLEATRHHAEQRTLNLITHELNTPLTPILLSAHVLRKRLGDRSSERDLDILDSIERNASRAMDMVKELIKRSQDADHEFHTSLPPDQIPPNLQVAKTVSEESSVNIRDDVPAPGK